MFFLFVFSMFLLFIDESQTRERVRTRKGVSERKMKDKTSSGASVEENGAGYHVDNLGDEIDTASLSERKSISPVRTKFHAAMSTGLVSSSMQVASEFTVDLRYLSIFKVFDCDVRRRTVGGSIQLCDISRGSQSSSRLEHLVVDSGGVSDLFKENEASGGSKDFTLVERDIAVPVFFEIVHSTFN